MAIRTVHPNPANCSPSELDQAIRATPSARARNRMLAIKMLLVGVEFALVCETFSIADQTLRNWICAFNRQGIDGLTDKPRSGCPACIPAEKCESLRDLLHHPSQADFTHWTAKKFHGHLAQYAQIEASYSTVLRWIHDQDFCLKVPRSWPVQQDEKARKDWLKTLQQLLPDPSVELWYQDEMGVEGDPRPRRRWAKKGEKITQEYMGTHLRMNVTGMVCPRTGEAFLLEFTHNDRDVFQAFLDEANATLQPTRSRHILILDNASWHKSKSLRWGRFEPLYLPAYSPDLNPIERLWLLIKAEWFTDFTARTLDELVARLDQALNWAMACKNDNQVTCASTKNF
jgi:transposase